MRFKRTQNTSAKPPQSTPAPSQQKPASSPPASAPPSSRRSGGMGRWLLLLSALGAAGVAALVTLDVPEDAPQWLLTAQAHTRALLDYWPQEKSIPVAQPRATPPSAPSPTPIAAQSAPAALAVATSAQDATPSDEVDTSAHSDLEEPLQVQDVPVSEPRTPEQSVMEPIAPATPAPEATLAAPSADAPVDTASEAPLSSPVERGIEGVTATEAVVAELRARIATLEEQRNTQTDLSQLVHEFQRERVAAYEAHMHELQALRSECERALDEQRREHATQLEGVEARLRVEYEAALTRLGNELAASYAAQLERVLAARDAEIAREYSSFSARVHEVLAETDAVARAVQARAESVQLGFEALRGEHGSANEALQLAAATAALRAAVLAAAPLETALQRAQKAASAFPAVLAALSAVPASARGGVQSHTSLSAQLSALEPAARRAADPSASSKLKEWLVQPPAGLVQGDDAASVLARARFHAERGALGAALQEVSALPPASQDVLKEWCGLAAARVHIDEALALAEAQVAAHAHAFREAAQM